jgi:hypothetical protein
MPYCQRIMIIFAVQSSKHVYVIINTSDLFLSIPNAETTEERLKKTLRNHNLFMLHKEPKKLIIMKPYNENRIIVVAGMNGNKGFHLRTYEAL